jgi:hypothetical protein
MVKLGVRRVIAVLDGLKVVDELTRPSVDEVVVVVWTVPYRGEEKFVKVLPPGSPWESGLLYVL